MFFSVNAAAAAPLPEPLPDFPHDLLVRAAEASDLKTLTLYQTGQRQSATTQMTHVARLSSSDGRGGRVADRAANSQCDRRPSFVSQPGHIFTIAKTPSHGAKTTTELPEHAEDGSRDVGPGGMIQGGVQAQRAG